MDEPLAKILTVAGAVGAAIVGVAVIATIVGKNASTAATINAATGGLAKVISAAVAPVSGSGTSIGNVAPLGDLNSGIATSGSDTSGIPTAGNLVNSASGLYSAASSGISGDQNFSSADIGSAFAGVPDLTGSGSF